MSVLDFIKFDEQSRVTQLLLSVLISLIVVQIFKRLREISRLPPGPYGLPIVGYLPFLGENHARDYVEMGKKYGSPFSVRLGKYDFVIINDWFHANEAFSKEELLARPPEGFAGGIARGGGLVDLSGEAWRDQKRTALHLLRDIGLGKSGMEEKIKEEIETFTNELDKQKGKPFNILELLSASTSNNICVLTYGKRFNYDDEDKIELDKITKAVSGDNSLTGLAIAMPYMVKFIKFPEVLSTNFSSTQQANPRNSMSFRSRSIRTRNTSMYQTTSMDFSRRWRRERREGFHKAHSQLRF